MVLLTCQNFTYTELSKMPFEEYNLIVEIISAKGRGEIQASERRKS